MVLQHISERPRVFVVARSIFYTNSLGDCNLHMIDKLSIPQWFKNGISKAQNQKILNRFFA
jgi:hypothetical protein